MRLSYHEYKAKAYKGTPQVYFDYFYRALSHPLTFILLRLGVTPNAMTAMSIVLAIAAGAIVVYGYPLLGLIVFMTSYLFDFCDGNAARAVIKTVGMPEVQQKRGNVLENLNTNLSLLSMYGSIGYYLGQWHGMSILAFSFFAFGIKMIARYTVRHSYDIFRGQEESLSPGEGFMRRYQEAPLVRVKFFFTKSFLAANFYYIIYLITFVFFASWAWLVLLVYGGLDVLISAARAANSVFRRYA